MPKFFVRTVALLLTFNLIQGPVFAQLAIEGPEFRKPFIGEFRALNSELILEQALASPSVAPSYAPEGMGDSPVHRQILEAEARERRPDNNPSQMDIQPAMVFIRPMVHSKTGKWATLTNGRTAIVGVVSGTVYITDLRGLKELAQLRLLQHASDIAISRNGNLLACAVDSFMHLWAVDERGMLSKHKTINLGETHVQSIALSHDGETLAAAASDDPDEEQAKPSLVIIQKQRVSAVMYGKKKEQIRLSGNGRRLFTFADNGKVSLWEVPSVDQSHRGIPSVIENPANSFYPGSGQAPGPRLLDMAISEMGDGLITLSEDSVVRLYNANRSFDAMHSKVSPMGPEKIPYEGAPEEKPMAVAISPDGRQAAIGYRNGLVKIWDLARHTQIAILGYEKPDQAGSIQSVLFTEDGLVAAVNAQGHFAWDIRALVPKQQTAALPFPSGTIRTIDAMRLSPEYRALVRLSEREPWRYWTINEIHAEPEFVLERRAGQQRWLTARHLAAMSSAENELVKVRRNGVANEYRLARSIDDARTAPAEESWGGRPKRIVLQDTQFRTAGSRYLLEHIFERFYQDAAKEEETSRQVVMELLWAYERLRRAGLLSTESLLHALRNEFKDSLLINTPQRLERGMQWLDLKGRVLRHVWIKPEEGNELSGWEISGLAAKRAINLDIETWPSWARDRWKELAKETMESRKATAERFELILTVNAIDVRELDPGAKSLFFDWRHDNVTADQVTYENMVKTYADRLGIHPIQVRYGDSAAALEEMWLPLFPSLSLGERTFRLRLLEGLIPKQAADRIGISVRALQRLEKLPDFPTDSKSLAMLQFPSPERWSRLAETYHREVWLILLGFRENVMFFQSISPGKLFRAIRLGTQHGLDSAKKILGIRKSVLIEWERTGPEGIALRDVFGVLRKELSPETLREPWKAYLFSKKSAAMQRRYARSTA